MNKILLLIGLLMTTSTYAQSWQNSNNMTDHDVFAGSNCVAWTDKGTVQVKSQSKDLTAGMAKIEVVSTVQSGQYTEPTVEVVISKTSGIPDAVTAVVKGSQGQYILDRVLFDSAQQKAVYLARLDDREALIGAIKDLSQLDVSLKVKDKSVATLSFNLKGSTKSVNQQFSDCGLSFQKLNPL